MVIVFFFLHVQNLHFFKYTASSLISSVLDWGIYLLMTDLLHGVMSGIALTAVPLVTARVISSWLNFEINQKLVFRSKGATGRKLMKYVVTVLLVALLHTGLTYGAYNLFHIAEQEVLLRGGIYALVMVALFFVSFFLQQKWVFVTKRGK